MTQTKEQMLASYASQGYGPNNRPPSCAGGGCGGFIQEPIKVEPLVSASSQPKFMSSSPSLFLPAPTLSAPIHHEPKDYGGKISHRKTKSYGWFNDKMIRELG